MGEGGERGREGGRAACTTAGLICRCAVDRNLPILLLLPPPSFSSRSTLALVCQVYYIHCDSSVFAVLPMSVAPVGLMAITAAAVVA